MKSYFGLLTMMAGLYVSPAAAEKFDVAYQATLAGFTVGTGRLTGGIADGAYLVRFKGEISLMGFSNRVDASANGSANGSANNARLVPQTFQLTMHGRQTRTVAITFADDKVLQVAMVPKPDATELRDRLPIEQQHQVGVLDPLSAMMSHVLRAAQTNDPCQGIAKVFSGQARFDVSLTSSTPAAGEIVCRATYRPIAGHKLAAAASARPAAAIVVAFPQMAGDGGMRLPTRIEFPLPVGTVVIKRLNLRAGL